VDRRKVEEYLVVSMSARQGQGYGDERISFEQREIWQALDHAFGWSGNRMTITKFCRGDAERVRHFLWPLGRLRNETPEGGWRDGASLQSLAYTIKSPVEINRAQAKAKKKILKSFGLTDWETMRTTTVLVGVVALVLLIVGVGLWVI